MPKKAAKSAHESPGEIAEQHLQLLDVGKQGYKAADSALELLLQHCESDPCPTCGSRRFKNGGVVKADGKTFRIVDKFAGKNSIPVGQSARRYQLEEIPTS